MCNHALHACWAGPQGSVHARRVLYQLSPRLSFNPGYFKFTSGNTVTCSVYRSQLRRLSSGSHSVWCPHCLQGMHFLLWSPVCRSIMQTSLSQIPRGTTDTLLLAKYNLGCKPTEGLASGHKLRGQHVHAEADGTARAGAGVHTAF